MKELIENQGRLKAPKGQYNSFGKYYYRSCEDILEAVKPLLHELKCILTISDDVEEVGGRIYIRATAKIRNSNGEIMEVSAFARESEIKKGMDESQITGASSSYARKYALNGLFLIDDTKDADFDNKGKEEKTEKPKGNLSKAIPAIKAAKTLKDLETLENFVNKNEWTQEELKELDLAISATKDGLK
jgi:hypothetical protein